MKKRTPKEMEADSLKFYLAREKLNADSALSFVKDTAEKIVLGICVMTPLMNKATKQSNFD